MSDMSFFIPYQTSSADLIDTDSIAFLYNNLQEAKASYTSTALSDALTQNIASSGSDSSVFANSNPELTALSQNAAYYGPAGNVGQIGVDIPQPNITFTNQLADRRSGNGGDAELLSALDLEAIQSVLGYDPLEAAPNDIGAIEAIDIMSDHLMHAFVEAVESNFDQLFMGTGMFRVSLGISGLALGGSSYYLGEEEQEEEKRTQDENIRKV